MINCHTCDSKGRSRNSDCDRLGGRPSFFLARLDLILSRLFCTQLHAFVALLGKSVDDFVWYLLLLPHVPWKCTNATDRPAAGFLNHFVQLKTEAMPVSTDSTLVPALSALQLELRHLFCKVLEGAWLAMAC